MTREGRPLPSEAAQPKPTFKDTLNILLRKDRNFRRSFDHLINRTQTLAVGQPDTEWLNDKSVVEKRWQKALSLAAYTYLDGYVDDFGNPDVVRQSMDIVNKSLEEKDWQTPGLSFKVLDEGYRWIEEQGGFLEERMFAVIDLRDMEYTGSVVPEDLAAFKALKEEDRQELREKLTASAEKGLYGRGNGYNFNVPALAGLYDQSSRFAQHMNHMKYGVPDRELTNDDLDAYALDLLVDRITKNPNYGKLPEEVKTMNKRIKLCLTEIFQYCHEMRSPHEPVEIDTYSLTQTMGMEYEDINRLVDSEIIKPVDSYSAPDGMLYAVYELTQQYYEVWWASAIRARHARKNSQS